MELMQLEMFVALVEERSVRKAAERVFRTQPAISISFKKLENEIGTALLEGPRRGGRKLTCAGEALYQCALQILGLRNEMLLRLKTYPPPTKVRPCVSGDRRESNDTTEIHHRDLSPILNAPSSQDI
jgi:DNA-binding transcriptional LysR family regulator